jgi:hypothetical protein
MTHQSLIDGEADRSRGFMARRNGKRKAAQAGHLFSQKERGAEYFPSSGRKIRMPSESLKVPPVSLKKTGSGIMNIPLMTLQSPD